MLGLVNSRRFACERGAPCFADGRGAALHTPAQIAAAVAKLASSAPKHHELLGVVPWKLFETLYAPVERHQNFYGLVEPLIATVHGRVAAALAAPDPDAFLRAERRAGARPRASRDAPSDADMQALFNNE